MDEVLYYVLFFLFWFFVGDFIGWFLASRAKKSKESEDNSLPINPNCSPPCPPHDWATSSRPGTVYECNNCEMQYPSYE